MSDEDCPASKDRLFGEGCSAAIGGEVSLDVLAEGFENKDASPDGSAGEGGAAGGQ